MASFTEKVAECGANYGMWVYSDKELMALATGIAPEKFSGSVQEIFSNPCAVDGVGEKKKLIVLAVKELVKRLAKGPEKLPPKIWGPEDVARYLYHKFKYETTETFGIVLLNAKNRIVGFQAISRGSLTATVVHPREVFKAATVASAAAIILTHNHPSGDPTPSKEDIALTNRMAKAGKIMDIPVLDHIIIGNGFKECYCSLKEKGMIE